jgi:cyclopropane fatty-acyl-phospholipid synthase-like methyltransferase
MSTFENPLARWNSRFSAEGYLFGEEPNVYLREQAHLLQPGKTLSVADGEGRNSVWLAQQGHRVDAFDFSPLAIEKAKGMAQSRGVSVGLSCCDWAGFDWRVGAYDNVVGIFFQFADAQERAQLFQKMAQALKPGGVLLIQGYHADQLKFNTGGPGVLENLYTEELMRSAFSQFDVLDLRVYEATIQEGTAHCGQSALLGYVGVKRA